MGLRSTYMKRKAIALFFPWGAIWLPLMMLSSLLYLIGFLVLCLPKIVNITSKFYRTGISLKVSQELPGLGSNQPKTIYLGLFWVELLVNLVFFLISEELNFLEFAWFEQNCSWIWLNCTHEKKINKKYKMRSWLEYLIVKPVDNSVTKGFVLFCMAYHR